MADEHHEIVIIRRGGHGAHDDHHGGVWKIAFADFMTAMMAFFLVMWLISANDKTRATIARYFNPVQLVDPTMQPRGMQDTKKDAPSVVQTPDTKNDKGAAEQKKAEADKFSSEKKPTASPKETAEAREKRLDTAMRDNPIAALAEIAGQESGGTPKAPTRSSAPVIGRQGGTAFRDPFAPPPPLPRATEDDSADLSSKPARPPAAGTKTPGKSNAVDQAALDAAALDKADTPADDKTPVKSAGRLAASADAAAKPGTETAADVVRDLKASLKGMTKDGSGPAVDVAKTGEGYLVSITDTSKFSMFSNGSAVPSRRVVALMDGLAKVLTARKGDIVIRGFTDNKPFHSGRYDNWSLSVDRAQAAHYMLVRGGIGEERFAKIEGFADRAHKPGLDPASPLNRRIEILLKDPAS